ncbi:hypothetical protein GRAN_4350 [Granulicella sibirica]|uniref:Uncharacterized protein n=1 Tax=Granulicella sibirica TaxID=2479048 RepID=A0A4Q0T1E2_9BACT|nr:hypothetical protein GRAN_4350 [Granulicella sibirica]
MARGLIDPALRWRARRSNRLGDGKRGETREGQGSEKKPGSSARHTCAPDAVARIIRRRTTERWRVGLYRFTRIIEK